MDKSTLSPLKNPLYKIKESLIIAQSDGLRVIDQTIAPGESIPWHLHPDTDDRYICLRGALQVRETNPTRTVVLHALDRYMVPKGVPHTTANASNEDCQFLIVQGPGRVEFHPLPELAECEGEVK